MTNNYIEHKGKVERIDKHKVFVRIEQTTACQGCHASPVCLSVNKKDKIIEVNDFSGCFFVQEEVIVSVKQTMGLMAAVIAFILPFLSVILSVIAGIYITGSEAVGGMLGLLILFPYYFILYLFRDKIKKKFVFSLSKIPV